MRVVHAPTWVPFLSLELAGEAIGAGGTDNLTWASTNQFRPEAQHTLTLPGGTMVETGS